MTQAKPHDSASTATRPPITRTCRVGPCTLLPHAPVTRSVRWSDGTSSHGSATDAHNGSACGTNANDQFEYADLDEAAEMFARLPLPA